MIKDSMISPRHTCGTWTSGRSPEDVQRSTVQLSLTTCRAKLGSFRVVDVIVEIAMYII